MCGPSAYRPLLIPDFIVHSDEPAARAAIRLFGRKFGRHMAVGGKCTSASCSSPPDAHSFFGSLVGTTSLADLKVPDWESKTKFLATTADAYYKRNARSGRKVPFNQLNNHMFKKQITKPDVARKNAQQWPEMYKSAAYKEVTDLIRPVCASFLQNGPRLFQIAL